MWNAFQSVDTVVSLIAAIFAFWGWVRSSQLLRANRELKRLQAEAVKIVLECDGKTFRIPYEPRRDQLSRAELLGVLGMYGDGNRFDPSHVAAAMEDGTYDRVLSGKTSELRIRCSGAVFGQFVKARDTQLEPAQT